MIVSSVLVALASTPLIPDGDGARELAEKELAKPEYQAAKPTLIDQWARAVVDFLIDMFTPQHGADLGPWAAIVIGVLLVAVLIAVLLIWGRPRRSRVRTTPSVLLGSADDRTAAELRAEADRAAREEDWAAAIVLRYRAVARSLIERDLIAPAPGATAQTIAREAVAPFPAEGDALHEAAVAFDDVRYLGHPGSAELYRALVQTDERLRSLRPVPIDAVPA
ncbi:protein of unknown function [Microbacterium azadirachtae]|uniref:Protein-glutamine gamma-glutamyltransferase-like C-terminal domain-containing protein n=1 Tax=Microbacterium azadirachtae TaxID=582680 RepID=A0A1I6GI94_9MICO|nr:DUF4129 domain-containing protein [Microbacterium azadirachtae]SFR41943.1 protein of unknown function [Microbacterium azadirachtae]